MAFKTQAAAAAAAAAAMAGQKDGERSFSGDAKRRRQWQNPSKIFQDPQVSRGLFLVLKTSKDIQSTYDTLIESQCHRYSAYNCTHTVLVTVYNCLHQPFAPAKVGHQRVGCVAE